MFLKTIKAGNHTYAQIVESYKENGISKHRILLNFGRVVYRKIELTPFVI